MDSLGGCIRKYKEQVRRGDIVTAYRGIMQFMTDFKKRMAKNHPDCDLSSSIYFGNMDITHFAFTPADFKQEKLKFIIAFMHEYCRFEIWLAANNKTVQGQYKLELISKDLGGLKITDGPSDSIVESVLTDVPDFDNPDALMRLIEEEALKFIERIRAVI